VGETHQNYNDIKIGLVGETHATDRPEPGQEERFDISSALALAATVAGKFYFGSADRRARARPRFAGARGRVGLRRED
jgi:hypothetical protein